MKNLAIIKSYAFIAFICFSLVPISAFSQMKTENKKGN